MAELEEIAEFSEEAEAGFEDAAEDAEELEPAEREELENEVEEAKESAGKMQKVITSLKELDVVAVLKKFTVFVAEQAAIGVIFFGVNVALSKILQGSKTASGSVDKDTSDKLSKTKALSALISDISTTSKTLTDWLKAHQSDTITIDMDITVPLTDIFIKYTDKMEKSLEVSYGVAQELTEKTDGGKVQFLTPTTDQVTKVVTSSGDFISALVDFMEYAKKKESEFPNLKTLPITQEDTVKLNADLKTVKDLPY